MFEKRIRRTHEEAIQDGEITDALKALWDAQSLVDSCLAVLEERKSILRCVAQAYLMEAADDELLRSKPDRRQDEGRHSGRGRGEEGRAGIEGIPQGD